mgnify:CR=1 FL=1
MTRTIPTWRGAARRPPGSERCPGLQGSVHSSVMARPIRAQPESDSGARTVIAGLLCGSASRQDGPGWPIVAGPNSQGGDLAMGSGVPLACPSSWRLTPTHAREWSTDNGPRLQVSSQAARRRPGHLARHLPRCSYWHPAPAPRQGRTAGHRRRSRDDRDLRTRPPTVAGVCPDKLRDAEVGGSNLPHPTRSEAVFGAGAESLPTSRVSEARPWESAASSMDCRGRPWRTSKSTGSASSTSVEGGALDRAREWLAFEAPLEAATLAALGLT